MADEDLQGLLNYAYFFLKFRPRTKKEVRDYLYKKIKKRHWSREDAEKALDQLKKQELIDDKKFVEWFVEQRNILNPKSEYVLRQELYKHGVEKETIENYFQEIPVEEERLAEQALKTRWLRFKSLPHDLRYQKATQFLLRRGFAFDTAKTVIKKLEIS